MSKAKHSPKKDEAAVVEADEQADAPVVERAVAPGYERRVVDPNLRSTSYGAILDSSHDQAAENAKAAEAESE